MMEGMLKRAFLTIGSIVGTSMSFASCADPCVDDGLGQDFCPAATDGGTDSATGGATDSDSDTSGSTTDPTVGSGGGTGDQCPLLDLTLTSENPTIVFLLDRSGSMSTMFSGGLNRWEAVRATLFDPTDGVVPALEAEIRFGLSMYDGGMSCPTLLEEAPKLNNSMDMETTFDAAGGPGSGTPTGESLTVVAPMVASDPDRGAKRIVLATDGEPDTCAAPDMTNGQPQAVTAAENSFMMGVPVSIISVGDGVGQMHLQDMANAGAGVMAGDPDATFYQALDQSSLLAAFNEILTAPRGCRFFLSDPIIESMASTQCVVTVNGTAVPLDPDNGWSTSSPNQIELNGTACTDIQDGQVEINMECECDAVDEA